MNALDSWYHVVHPGECFLIRAARPLLCHHQHSLVSQDIDGEHRDSGGGRGRGGGEGRGREKLIVNFMACIPHILWCTYIHTQKQLKIYGFLSKPYRLNCVPTSQVSSAGLNDNQDIIPSPEDEGVRFHSHHCGYDVLRVVSAPGHLDQSVQSPTDEHQSSLWSSVPAITHSLSQSVSQQHTYRH